MANFDGFLGLGLFLISLYLTTQHKPSVQNVAEKFGTSFTILLLQMSHYQSEHEEAGPGLEKRCGQGPLDLPSQDSWLLHFGWSNPGKGPGRAGLSARAIASLGPAGYAAGQRGLRFPESRVWRSWHGPLFAGQILCGEGF